MTKGDQDGQTPPCARRKPGTATSYKVRLALIATLAASTLAVPPNSGMADLLAMPDVKLCLEQLGPAGSAEVTCQPYPFEGFDAQFCRPLPGFDENVQVIMGVGSTWSLTDCQTGQGLQVLVWDQAQNLDLFAEMNRYRENLLAFGTRPTLADIVSHMAQFGGKSEFDATPLSPEDTQRFCSYAVPRSEPCLSSANPEPRF